MPVHRSAAAGFASTARDSSPLLDGPNIGYGCRHLVTASGRRSCSPTPARMEILGEGDMGDLAPEQGRILSVIERNARRLLRLVDDLLVVARSDVGRLGIAPERLDLAELARECVQGARPAAAEQGIEISAEVDGPPVPVSADRARLGQVVDNLISNALKFTPAGGRVRVSVRAEEGRALLEVADTGVGIPRGEQERLFERFYRTSQAIASATPGTGLGLAISKMIVEAHHGRIEVQSEEGAGASFRVLLPLAAGPPGTQADRGRRARSPVGAQ